MSGNKQASEIVARYAGYIPECTPGVSQYHVLISIPGQLLASVMLVFICAANYLTPNWWGHWYDWGSIGQIPGEKPA